jgi:hypothetical protein
MGRDVIGEPIPYGKKPKSFLVLREKDGELPWVYFSPVCFEYKGRLENRKSVIVSFVRYNRLASSLNVDTMKAKGWFFREDL